jgi:LysR family transcriptional regulator, glycine cleavage system transcriptional activator
MPTLPPLRALQAFEASARHMSVARAAEELSVTPSAISHQLKALEAFLGVRLFHRFNRRIALTDTGRGYVQLLASGFDRIARATDHVIAGGVSDVLTVHCSPSFAPAWLLPRLGGFMAAHRGIDLRIHATPEPPDFFRSDTDVVSLRQRRLAGPHGGAVDA